MEPDLCDVCEQLILILAATFADYLDVAGSGYTRSTRASLISTCPSPAAASVMCLQVHPAILSALELAIAVNSAFCSAQR